MNNQMDNLFRSVLILLNKYQTNTKGDGVRTSSGDLCSSAHPFTAIWYHL